MNHNGVNFSIVPCMILSAAWHERFLKRFRLEIKLFVVENTYLDFVCPFFKNIWILIVTALNGYVNLFIQNDIVKNDFYQLFGGTEFRNVPNAFGQLDCWVLVKDKTFESCGGVIDVVSRVGKPEEDFF
jgi:hypothetical protein